MNWSWGSAPSQIFVSIFMSDPNRLLHRPIVLDVLLDVSFAAHPGACAAQISFCLHGTP